MKESKKLSSILVSVLYIPVLAPVHVTVVNFYFEHQKPWQRHHPRLEKHPLHNYSKTGNYEATLIATNDCFTDTFIKTVNAFTDGILNAELSDIQIYPNPAKGFFYLHLDNFSAKEIQLTLISSNGTVVISEKFGKNKTTINKKIKTSELKRGVYFIKLKSEKGIVIKKLMLF